MRPNAPASTSTLAAARRIAVATLLAALALVGRGVAAPPQTHAAPAKIWVINMNVADSQAAAAGCTVPFACNLSAAADRAALAADFDTIQTESGGQVGAQQSPALSTFAGKVIILVETDGSLTNVQMNGRGLLCVPACDAVAGATPDATDHIAVFAVTDGGTHARGDMFVVTAIQDAISIDSRVFAVVGQAHDLVLSSARLTIEEGAASCALADSASALTRSAAKATFVDINGTQLVGYSVSWGTSATSTMAIASPQTTSRALGAATAAAPNVACGVAPGTANLSAMNAVANAVAGVTYVMRSQAITVRGVPASIALTASPALIACDGASTSTVTAMVLDVNGQPVVDGTNVNFNVAALGTSNPFNTPSVGGQASSTITPLNGGEAGVIVTVTAGTIANQIAIDCMSPGPDSSSHPLQVPQLPYDGVLYTAGFTTELGESLPCGNMGATAWYELSLPLGGADLTVDTAGSAFNTALAVYTMPPMSPPGSLALLGCDASDGYGAKSSVRFIASSPGTFLIQAGGQGGATGWLSLHVRCTNDLDCDGLTDADEALLGTNPGVADTDGDGLTDGLEVHTYHTNPNLPDTDADGCGDGKELHFVPPLAPTDAWDFYSVPVPALFAAPNPLSDVRDHIVGAADAQSVFAYFKKAAKTGSVEYEQDADANGVKDGIQYDRSVLGPALSGPPDGIVSATDAQLAFAQFKKGYKC